MTDLLPSVVEQLRLALLSDIDPDREIELRRANGSER